MDNAQLSVKVFDWYRVQDEKGILLFHLVDTAGDREHCGRTPPH